MTLLGQILVTVSRELMEEVRFEEETVWLTQEQSAELLQTTVPSVSVHLRNVLAVGELRTEASVQNVLAVRRAGDRRVHSLDVVARIDVASTDKELLSVLRDTNGEAGQA